MTNPKLGQLVQLTAECWGRTPRDYPKDAVFLVLDVDLSDPRWPCARIAHPTTGTLWVAVGNIKPSRGLK